MRTNRGFTLVELLVVIVVLVLLLSILIPSLNVAKDLARQVCCAANMNAAGKSLQLYAEKNDGKMPPFRMGAKGIYYMTTPELSQYIAKVGDIGPHYQLQWRGAGFVYASGYIESPDFFYCPAQAYPWFTRQEYTDPNGMAPFGTYSPTTYIRSGYLWNAWGKKYEQPDLSGRSYMDLAFRTVASMESDKPIIIDHPIFPWALQVHTARGRGTPTFNVAYCDSHVESHTPPEAYTQTLLGAWNSVLKNWIDNPGDDNDWAEAWSILRGG